MLVPIDILWIFTKNFKNLKKDYNLLNLLVSFFIIPFLASVIFIFLFKENSRIFKDSINFISIIIGFLINAIVILINSKKYSDKYFKELEEHLVYNILNAILIGIIYILLVLFTLNSNSKIVLFILYFLLFYFIILIFNIIRKFSVFIIKRSDNKK